MYLIRDFGRNSFCMTAEELQTLLTSKYLNNSISVQYQKESGMTNSIFLDVSKEGVVTESFGENSMYDFNTIPKSHSKNQCPTCTGKTLNEVEESKTHAEEFNADIHIYCECYRFLGTVKNDQFEV